jgi:hypothetical protein
MRAVSAKRRSGGGLLAVVAGVSGVTAANRAGLVGVASLASSPRTAAEGKLWLLLTSAFIADSPTAASLLAFLAFAVAALVVCGPRLTWTIGLAGHVGSAAAVYAAIAVTRAIVPTAFDNVLSLSDYGTSAMIAAWLGALAAAGWIRYPRLMPRLGVIAFSLLSAGVGWVCRPDLTPLDSEHLVAYAIGVAAVSGAAWEYPRRVVREWLAMARGGFRRAYARVGRLGLALRQQQV